jgi:hypothetical protein
MQAVKVLFIIIVLGFSLVINGLSHGTGWVITQEAHRLGIYKDWMELTPADIDRLSDKQANGLAKIEQLPGIVCTAAGWAEQ